MPDYITTGRALRLSDTDLSSPTSGTLNFGRVIRDVASAIALLDANNTALLTFLMHLRKMPTHSMKFEWYEDVFPERTITLAASSSTDTTMAADTTTDLTLFREGDLWLNGDSGEIIYISAVTASSLTVKRGVGSTDAQAVATGDNWFYIGNAMDQGDTARDMLTTQTEQVYNYAQLFKEPYEVVNDVKATKLYGGPDLTYLRSKHGELHKRDIERMLWFGVRDDLTSSDASNITHEVYTSKGLLADGTNGFLTTNTSTASSASDVYTEDEFDTDLITAFRYGGQVKMAFCSPQALGVISSWGRDKLHMVPRDKTYGINVTRFISPHGELNLIRNVLFQEFATAGTPSWGEGLAYGECAVILDMENLYLRTHRDTVLEQNIQANDADSSKEQYITRVGLECRNEETHMDIYGIRNS